jgi:TonB-dependent starch-binding outer membrane protein SusC
MMKDYFVVSYKFLLKEKIIKCVFALVIAFFFYSGNAVASSNTLLSEVQGTIKGSVYDSNGNPLTGATIVVKSNPTIGTMADDKGNFILNVAKGTELSVSFIGYETQTVIAEDNMKITLADAVNKMDEIVIVGYGSVKKSDLTGSVSSISTKAYLDQSPSSGNSILVGRAPGVSVSRSNGAPGKGFTIRIRGANSLYGGNDPLVVVDGTYGGIPDANDIESIEILKDASATAIYGSRGANGVILVKTKYGSSGKPKLSIFSNYTIDKMPKYYDLMDAYEFAEFNNRVGTYSFTSDELAGYKENGGTNWQKSITQTGVNQTHKVVLSGGTDKIKYYISPDYNKSTGIIKNVESESYALNSKVEMDLSKNINLEIKAGLGHAFTKNPDMATGGSKTSIPLMGAMLWSPTESIYDADGGYNRLGIGTGAIINPLLMTTLKKTNYSNSGNGETNLKVKIFEGLDLNAKALVNFYNTGSRNFESSEYTGVYATASQASNEGKTWLLNWYMTYNKTIAELHNFSLMGGFEETKNENRYFSATADNLPLESVGWDDLGLASPNVEVSSGYSNSAMRSYFGRFNYNYASRYYLTVNYRADGSSKFKGSNQWGYFPSFSLAWKLSQEEFMKSQNIFQNVKIRGGWGTIGNQAISSYETYTTLGSRNWSWGTSTSYAGYFAKVGGNENLKWETTRQGNIGIDLGVLNNRLNLTMDYYNKKTVDLLAPVSVTGYNGGDSEYGTSTVISNVGSVRNEGFEFSIDYVVINNNDFSYDVNFNGALNKNKVISLGKNSIIYGDTYAAGLTSVSPFALIPGHQIGSIYGLKYLGIWQQSESEEAAKYGQVPGDYKYQDVDGDHTYDSDDKQVIGHTNPSFSWGFNNHLSYKDFDLNILFEGVHGRDVMNWSYMVGTEAGTVAAFYNLRAAKNRWTPSNTHAEFARVGATNDMQPLSSQYMQNGSYIKLRNISLSYRVPRSLVSFASIRVSISAQNILTITKYKGLDPEISSSEGSDISSGMDWFAYPNPKSISFGVSLEY